MDNIRTPYIRTPHIGTPSIRTFSVGGSGVGKKPEPILVVATPVITITDTTATITCETENASIYYTLDGSTPTSSSTEYSSAITLTQSCTIKAIAVKSGMTDSEVASEDYVATQYLTAWRLVGNSEVKTLPYPDGVVLPSGYKRCEYLESDGTAYIEVPFGFDKTDEVYAKVAMLDITHPDKYFIAPKTWNDRNNRFAMGVHGSTTQGNQNWCCAYGNQATGATFLEPRTTADTNAHIWQYKNYVFTLEDIGSKDVSSGTFDSETANLRLFFGYNTPTECQICEYRHKKANAEYRLIPCLDSNDTPCMYDVINSQAYYNSAGSGSFTYKLYPQPTEIWSCGELSTTDNKYHIYVSSNGKVFDIALTEPLRKVNDIADTIEFPSTTEGKALVTRNLRSVDWSSARISKGSSPVIYFVIYDSGIKIATNNILSAIYTTYSYNTSPANFGGLGVAGHGTDAIIRIVNEDMNEFTAEQFRTANADVDIIYELATPTTETITVPEIEVSSTDTYTQIISQGAKAVAWTSFDPDPE